MLPVAVLLITAFVLWQMATASSLLLLAGLATGLGAVAIGAGYSARAQGAARRAQEAEFDRAEAAVAAVEKVLLWSADELCRGEHPPLPDGKPLLSGPASRRLGAVLGDLQVQAVKSLCRVQDESQSMVLLEVLRRLAKREHTLVTRSLEALSKLEKLTDDPDLLAQIFAIDHLVTRLRRQVESTAVLGGESLRSERTPVSVLTVLRGACSEVLQYQRVRTVTGPLGTELAFPGHVGPDLTHILAELIENSCESSDPTTRVTVRAGRVSAGLAIEVEDRALPMTAETRARMNQLLASPDAVDVSGQVRAGQLGLLVAATIAQRHGMSITLQENPTGGTTALVVVPAGLLVAIAPIAAAAPRSRSPRPADRIPTQAASVQPGQAARPAPPLSPSRAATADTDNPPGGVRPLPQRQPGESVFQPPQRQQAPVGAPTPGLVGDFHAGARAGAASVHPGSEPDPRR
ncbi:ATP-binding protein [Streptomyces sp. NPDC048208]|uniref:sensor histidine kinase n=1 Tax=Streptomyces sp. NPDC048208 TaxID=3365515 RepID=UPI003722F93A